MVCVCTLGLSLEERERVRAGTQWAPPCLQGAGPGLATPVLEQVSGLGLDQKGTVGTARTREEEGGDLATLLSLVQAALRNWVALPPPAALSNALHI